MSYLGQISSTCMILQTVVSLHHWNEMFFGARFERVEILGSLVRLGIPNNVSGGKKSSQGDANPTMDEVPLSLGTFEPNHALEPYLNTPRSLEACRRHGINPVELVEIPFDEFKRAFPNDHDTAMRRYERIDGARRKMFVNVLKEWDKICENGWQPGLRDVPRGETIIEVEDEHRSTLLEIQARNFRKIESDQFKAMNRMIGMQLKNAVKETKNREILTKQKKSGDNFEQVKQQRLKQADDLRKSQVEALKRQEEERAEELRQLQKLENEKAVQVAYERKEKDRQDRLKRESLEEERKRREDFRKEMNLTRNEENRKRADNMLAELNAKDREVQTRIHQFKHGVQGDKARRRKERDDKIQKARQDLYDNERKKLEDGNKKVEEEAAARRKEKADKAAQDRLDKIESDRLAREKANQIRLQSEKDLQSKIDRTLSAAQLKQALFEQGMDKLHAAQERRRTYKMIRQEAYELAASRRKKADDYREAKLKKELERRGCIYFFSE